MTIGVIDSRDLLERARAGDADAYCELCRDYEAGLARQAAALCGDYAQGEDLAQETLVEAWRCLRRYNGRCQFFTWLCAILLNRHRNTLRRKRLLAFLPFLKQDGEFDNAVDMAADQELRPDQAAQLREQTDAIRKCVLALPPKHQQVVYLRFYVDDSLEGVAEALGCSVGTVKSRIFHALEKLRGMREISAQYTMKGGGL
jgi:RNA polymerase sigma-70 factor (ECF subfamily)